ncbi:MAG: GIY-YIG nuclease family protein [bacterium]|nr:GIY-YIG nuclease family protein [bacterium]
MYYVYILLLNNNNLYTGMTADLEERFKDHSYGKVKSTRNFRPLKMIHNESYILKSDAMRREKFLKTTEGKRLLRQQIRDILNKYIDDNSRAVT